MGISISFAVKISFHAVHVGGRIMPLKMQWAFQSHLQWRYLFTQSMLVARSFATEQFDGQSKSHIRKNSSGDLLSYILLITMIYFGQLEQFKVDPLFSLQTLHIIQLLAVQGSSSSSIEVSLSRTSILPQGWQLGMTGWYHFSIHWSNISHIQFKICFCFMNPSLLLNPLACLRPDSGCQMNFGCCISVAMDSFQTSKFFLGYCASWLSLLRIFKIRYCNFLKINRIVLYQVSLLVQKVAS